MALGALMLQTALGTLMRHIATDGAGDIDAAY